MSMERDNEPRKPRFTETGINLASAGLGARAVSASDEFFAPLARLLEDAPAVFYPDRWVGQDLFSIPLADYMLAEDVALLPDTGLLVFYRQQCDHCRDHLLELASSELGERRLGLIRVPEPNDTPGNSLIVVKPEGPHVSEVSLFEGVEYVLSTPAEAEVEGFVVTAAREGVH